MNKDIVIHICCAACAVYPVEKLVKDGYSVTGFWYNPNIHPYVEYTKRLQSLKHYSELIDLDTVYDESYDLDEFLRQVSSNPSVPERCYHCYRMRLQRTAEFTKQEGLELFTSTLSVSPYQNHNLLIAVANEAAKRVGVKFKYIDFREGYRQGHNKARELGLYMQKYCGCIYSERDRFIDMKPENIVKKF
ncbi:MAG: hypothetical protein GF315_11425 [candidate division Zixibacteria bacterium]|nr:hypothetical protein [candidate division Zixibacteria bacterium]